MKEHEETHAILLGCNYLQKKQPPAPKTDQGQGQNTVYCWLIMP